MLEQSASSEAGRQRPSTSEQPEGAGRAEAFRQQAAPHLSQSAELRQQPSQGPEMQASTGSKSTIRDLLNRNGIYLKIYAPAQYNALICPTCKGGSSSEESLSVKIEDDGQSAVWKCHRGTCGWEGGCSLLSDSPGATAPGVAPASVTFLTTCNYGWNGGCSLQADSPGLPVTKRVGAHSAFHASQGRSCSQPCVVRSLTC